MTRSKITAFLTAIALLAPAAPAAALNRVCLTVNTDNYGFTRANYKAKIHVQKLSRDQVWAAAWLDFVENFRFLDIRSAGYPEVESRTSELAVGRRVGVSAADADACVDVRGMLSEGDLFRLRIETEYGASSVCVHNLENDSDIFGDAPHFFLTSTGRGEDLYVKTTGTVGHPECLYSHGYQRTPLACVHESILMPGCRWRGPGNDDRVQGWAQDTIQYITGGGGHAGPLRNGIPPAHGRRPQHGPFRRRHPPAPRRRPRRRQLHQIPPARRRPPARRLRRQNAPASGD